MTWARATVMIVSNLLVVVLVAFVCLFAGQCTGCVDILDQHGHNPCEGSDQ